jgi:uncharacterized membrane protein HdeD (DUF308 family)
MTTDIQAPDIAALQTQFRSAVRAHWVAFLIEGILLAVFGVLAIGLPLIASLTITLMLGWFFLISGIFGLVLTFWARAMPGFWWGLVSAVLGIVTGVILLAWPIQGAISLTLVLGAYFLIEGISSIMYGVGHRSVVSRWGWMVAAGVIDILLGLFIIAGLPGTAGIALGILVGINLVIGGTSLMAMAIAARSTPAT